MEGQHVSPLKRVLDDLPTPAKTRDEGCPPDPEPTFLRPYFDALRARHEQAGAKPHAVAGTRFRHSMAGDCARAIAYHALNVPVSDPMDLAGMYVTSNGTQKHEAIQGVLTGSGVEPEVRCQIEGFDGSGSADGLQVVDGQRICWELKNIGGFAFKLAVGERGSAQGPKMAHRTQGALNALAMDADLLVISYMTWEAISVGIAERKGFTEEGRISAQWTFQREEWEPWAQGEVKRVSGILGLVDEGILPARKHPELPAGAVLTDPSSGAWRIVDEEDKIVDAGSWWSCGYCRHQSICQGTASGRQPIADVADHLGIESEPKGDQ